MRAQLENVIAFWQQHSVDSSHGGFFTFLDRKGVVQKTDKAMWVQYRAVWMWSKLYNSYQKNSQWLEYARRGVEFIDSVRAVNDRAFMVSQIGEVLEMREDVYTQCYACIAYAEFAHASGDDESRQKAIVLFEKIVERITKEMQEKKIHAHYMILLIVAQAVRDTIGHERTDEAIAYALNGIVVCVSVVDNMLYEANDDKRMDVGHTVESMWFVLDEMKLHPQQKIIEQMLQVLEWVWKKHGIRKMAGYGLKSLWV